MSVPFDPKILTRRTTADLSSSAWFLVKPSNENNLAVAGAGELAIGALTNDVGDGTVPGGIYVPVQIGGIIKAIAGGAITVGTLAMSDGSGEAVTATDGNYAFGIALGNYVDGEVGAFIWAPSYLETT